MKMGLCACLLRRRRFGAGAEEAPNNCFQKANTRFAPLRGAGSGAAASPREVASGPFALGLVPPPLLLLLPISLEIKKVDDEGSLAGCVLAQFQYPDRFSFH